MSTTPREASGLQGQLEDLALLDMLQIVAFSRKTGFLQIEGSLGRGAVVFRDGLVVFAHSWSTLQFVRELGDEPDYAEHAAFLQKQVEISLLELAGLREGRFNFQVTPSPPSEIDGMMVAPFYLEDGINPEALLLDLAKDMDEERRETSDLLESGAPATAEPMSVAPSPVDAARSAPAPPSRPPEGLLSVLLVDDEAPVRRILGDALRGAGYRVYTASTPSEGAGMAAEIDLSGESFLVVTDLGMPTSSGRSFRGGLELANSLHKNRPQTPVLLMAERASPKARARARELGVRKIALKPALSKLDPRQYEQDLRSFASAIVQLLPSLDGPPADEVRPTMSAGGEDETSAPFLDFITSMSEQLLSQRRSADLSKLVLEVAAKYLERGILFLIKAEKVSGLGGFGLPAREQANLELARSVRFGLQDARPFAEVAYGAKTQRFSAELEAFETLLYARVGRGRANECVLVPMLNNGEVLVILYGDNAASGRPIGKLRGLELFMSQAGMALENAYLHHKLRLFESKLSRRPAGSVTSDG